MSFFKKAIYLGARLGEPSGLSLRPLKINLAPLPPPDKPMDTRSVVDRLKTGAPVAAIDLCVELGAPGPLTDEVVMRVATELLDSKNGLSAMSLRDELQTLGYQVGQQAALDWKSAALRHFYTQDIPVRSRTYAGERHWRRQGAKA